MPKIETKTGSATDPQPEGGRGIMIVHICNDIGAWAKGFVLAVNKLSMWPKLAYQAFAKFHDGLIPRGLVQFVEISPRVFIANMIAQQGIDPGRVKDGVMVDYAALQKCLKTAFERALQLDCDVHITEGMGSGLAGGDKTLIHGMIDAQAREVEHLADIEETSVSENYGLNITLWEFTDTSSDSFVVPSQHSTTVVSPAPLSKPQSVPDTILGDSTPTEDDV